MAGETSVDSWVLEPTKSSIEFVAKNLGFGVKGKFKSFSVSVKYDGEHLNTATVAASIDAASIDTGIGLRDQHLRAKDFFDIEKFPRVEFKATEVIVKPSGDFDIVGVLSLHGVSEKITLHAKPLNQPAPGKDGKVHLAISATAKVNRKDFSIGGIFAATVSKFVDIYLNVELVHE